MLAEHADRFIPSPYGTSMASGSAASAQAKRDRRGRAAPRERGHRHPIPRRPKESQVTGIAELRLEVIAFLDEARVLLERAGAPLNRDEHYRGLAEAIANEARKVS